MFETVKVKVFVLGWYLLFYRVKEGKNKIKSRDRERDKQNKRPSLFLFCFTDPNIEICNFLYHPTRKFVICNQFVYLYVYNWFNSLSCKFLDTSLIITILTVILFLWLNRNSYRGVEWGSLFERRIKLWVQSTT